MSDIPLDRLTADQRATISNTICGDLASAEELEPMGLLKIRRVMPTARGAVAFFELTKLGEAFVARHYVVSTTGRGT